MASTTASLMIPIARATTKWKMPSVTPAAAKMSGTPTTRTNRQSRTIPTTLTASLASFISKPPDCPQTLRQSDYDLMHSALAPLYEEPAGDVPSKILKHFTTFACLRQQQVYVKLSKEH